MEHVTTRDYIDYGWRIIPVAENKIPMIKGWSNPTTYVPPKLFSRARYISQVCGQQPNGEIIIGLDFDHKPEDGIDATASYQAFRDRLPAALLNKLWVSTSTNGQGFHVRAEVPRLVAQSILRDANGKKTGDLRSTGGHLIIQQPDKWLHGAPWSLIKLTTAELDTLLAAVHYREPAASDNDHSLNTTAIAHWEQHINELIKDGLPHRFTRVSQAVSYIRGTVPIGHTSEARYAIIEDLISAGYSDEQTYVLALQFADLEASNRRRRGTAWLEKDIVRIIGKVRSNGTRTRYKGRRVHQHEIPVEIDRGGRPPKLHIEQYLYHLQSRAVGDRVLDTQKQIAVELKCSQRTIQRLEREATVIGRIKRTVTKDRQSSFIVLLERDDKTDDTQQVNTSVTLPTEACQGGSGGENGMSAPQNGMQELPPGVMRDTDGYPVTLQLVEVAMRMVANVRSRENKRRAITAFVQAYDETVTPEWITYLWERADKWERQCRADDRLKTKLRSMTDRQLRTMEAAASRRTEMAHARGSPGEAWVHGRRAWFIAREWERRQPLRKVLFEQQVIE